MRRSVTFRRAWKELCRPRFPRGWESRKERFCSVLLVSCRSWGMQQLLGVVLGRFCWVISNINTLLAGIWLLIRALHAPCFSRGCWGSFFPPRRQGKQIYPLTGGIGVWGLQHGWVSSLCSQGLTAVTKIFGIFILGESMVPSLAVGHQRVTTRHKPKSGGDVCPSCIKCQEF